MITERFEMIDGNHRKFWEVSYPSHGSGKSYWIARWGRIGTTGQSKVFHESSRQAASDAARQKIDEKLSKGYLQVDLVLPPKPGAAHNLPPLKVKLVPAVAYTTGGHSYLPLAAPPSPNKPAREPKPVMPLTGKRKFYLED